MGDSDSRAETIAIIGAGEMGAAVGQRLRETGARVITTLKDRSAPSIQRARQAGLEVVNDDDRLAREAGILLSIVPPAQAAAVADRFRGALTRTHDKPVFVECNAISPATVRRIADSLAVTGCRFIDAGIIGGPPPARRIDLGPRFYASGTDASELTRLQKFGLQIVILDGPVGAASAFKMSYAGLTKGLVAIGTAMIGAASREGLASALHEELARSQPGLLAMLRGAAPRMFPKANRWVAEMEQIAEFLGSAEAGNGIYAGAARLYDRVAGEWEHDGEDGASIAAIRSFFETASSPSRGDPSSR